MQCATCQHWAMWTYDPSLGSCKKVVRFWEAYEWLGEGDGEVLNEERYNSKFFVQDGEDYSASLFTRNDFGCVEHQEKTND